MEIDMSDKEAETQLLELVRGQDSKGFTLTVSSDSGRWTVTTADLDANTKTVGEAGLFNAVWSAVLGPLCHTCEAMCDA